MSTSPWLSRALPRLTAVVLAAALIAVFVARARLTRTLNINWDELHFLAQVHAHVRGELTAKLLTFHVHLFSWVTTTSTSSNEADQVLTIRLVMFGAGVVSCVCLAFIAHRLFRSATAALFAAFVGQSTAYVMNHGASARFDPLVAAFASLSAALLVARATTSSRPGRGLAAAAGLAFALAALVSIKTVLFAPALLALFFWPVLDAGPLRFAGARAALRNALHALAWFGAVALASFSALFALHASSLATRSVNAIAEGADSAPQKTVGTGGGLGGLVDLVDRQFPGELLPNPDYFVASLRWDWPFWFLFAAGVALACVSIGAREEPERRRTALKALCFALPLASILLYRNSFSYFYVCVGPPAALVTALVVSRIEQRFAVRPLVVALLVVLLALPSARQAMRFFQYNSDDQVSAQRRTIDAVHAVFPEPVPYFDRCGMIGSFPKVGPFMTTWVLEDYRRGKKPIMPELLAKQRPQFVLANVETLELTRAYGGREPRRLLKDDFFALRDSFIPHWGPLWVAGKRLDLTADTDTAFDLLVPGSYVVETANDEVAIDGVTHRAGDVVDLALGAHRARVARATTLTLRIASAGPAPKIEPPAGRLFTTLGFRASPPEPKKPR